MKRFRFTLIEMIVALAVLTMVMLLAGMALSSTQTTYRVITGHADKLARNRTIDRIADTAFRNATPFYWKDRNNKEVMIFDGQTDTLTLSYLHRISDRQEGGIRFLRLFRQGNRLIAEYRPLPFLNDGREEYVFEREVIAEDVVGLAFIYADWRDRRLEWYDAWDAEQKRNLPMAIQMELEFKDGEKQVWLRRTAGNGQFQEWGRRLKPER